MGCSTSKQHSSTSKQLSCKLGYRNLEGPRPPDGFVCTRSFPLSDDFIDARWDDDGFNRWATVQTHDGVYGIGWLRVGYVRRIAAEGKCLPARDDAPAGALYFGKPPPHIQLFGALWCKLNSGVDTNPDPSGDNLRSLVAILDREAWSGGPPEANDEDLLFVDYTSVHNVEPKWNLLSNDGGRTFLGVEDLPSRDQVLGVLKATVVRGYGWMDVYHRFRTIVLPKSAPADPPFNEQAFNMTAMIKASFCQRVVNAGDPNIKCFADPHAYATPTSFGLLLTQLKPPRLVNWVAALLAGAVVQMPKVIDDEVGFRRFCEYSQVAWLRVEAVDQFAARGGPFPRRQDLPADAYIVGQPPTASRLFVISHGWEAEFHPSPSGGKMIMLATALRKAGAKDGDVVFIDYCSLPQMKRTVPGIYYDMNQVAYQTDRTLGEQRQFKYALWDMGRLYAFKRCEVLVLPNLSQKGYNGDWGKVNPTCYEMRGWCCAEFSVALYNKRIRNLDDNDVQRIHACRKWPNTVQEYGQMMSEAIEKPVLFTSKGDRAVVTYNFFKMCIGLQSAIPKDFNGREAPH